MRIVCELLFPTPLASDATSINVGSPPTEFSSWRVLFVGRYRMKSFSTPEQCLEWILFSRFQRNGETFERDSNGSFNKFRCRTILVLKQAGIYSGMSPRLRVAEQMEGGHGTSGRWRRRCFICKALSDLTNGDTHYFYVADDRRIPFMLRNDLAPIRIVKVLHCGTFDIRSYETYTFTELWILIFALNTNSFCFMETHNPNLFYMLIIQSYLGMKLGGKTLNAVKPRTHFAALMQKHVVPCRRRKLCKVHKVRERRGKAFICRLVTARDKCGRAPRRTTASRTRRDYAQL